jgi:GT2 family glycosyltransferase
MSQASAVVSRSIGVVIPTYDRDDLLETCLEHVARQTVRPARIIIIDNGTRNIMPEFLRKFELLDWIPLCGNRGTAVAFNLGIGAAKDCDYVFLLNNDVEMEPECLSHLVQELEQDRSYSAAVPKLLRWSDPRYLDGVGDEILLGGGAYRVGNGELDAGQYDEPGPVFSACAAAALYRTSLFEDIGCFDEDFFAYREDVDLGLRAQLRGHRCLYVPTARAHHRGGATLGSPFHSETIRLSTRNQILAIIKNYPSSTIWRLAPRLVAFQFFWLGLAIRKRAFVGYCRGALNAISLVPSALKKRSEIQSKRLVASESVLSIMKASEERIRRWYDSPHTIRSPQLLRFYFGIFRALECESAKRRNQ